MDLTLHIQPWLVSKLWILNKHTPVWSPPQLLGELHALNRPPWWFGLLHPPPSSLATLLCTPFQESSSTSQQMWCNLPVVMNRGRLHAWLPPQAQMDDSGIKVLPAPQWPTHSRRVGTDDAPVSVFSPMFARRFLFAPLLRLLIFLKPVWSAEACDVSSHSGKAQ